MHLNVHLQLDGSGQESLYPPGVYPTRLKIPASFGMIHLNSGRYEWYREVPGRERVGGKERGEGVGVPLSRPRDSGEA